MLFAFLLCGALPARAFAQACAPVVAGGVVVTEGRGGTRGSIAASARGVAVGWEEYDRPAPERGLDASDPPFRFYARALDRGTLAPQGPARLVTERAESYVHPQPGAVAAMPDGVLVAPQCFCTGGSGTSGCSAMAVVGGADPSFRPAITRGGGCGRTRPAVTAAGPNGLLVSPAAERDATFVYSTALASPSMFRFLETDALAASPLDAGRGVLVARTGGAVRGFVLEASAHVSGDVALSAAGDAVGAPAVAGVGGNALAVFAARRASSQPWRLQLVRWNPGQAPTRSTLATGDAPAMAPAIVPSQQAGCALVSWTEGTGRGTVARVGRVCNGVLDAASVAQLSRPGVEAGDSELATDGTTVFALWQELGAPRTRASVELRVAALQCR